MSCNEVQEHLGAYLDEELPDDLREKVARHLSDCARCRAELDAWKRVTGTMREPASVEPPAALWGAIRQRMDTPRASFAPAYRRAWLAAAVILLAAGLGLYSLMPRQSAGPKSAEAAAAGVVDLGVLIDRLPQGIDAAWAAMVERYAARPVQPDELSILGRDLGGEPPRQLPGGLTLERAYQFSVDGHTALVARYEHDKDVLVTLFYPPGVEHRYRGHHEGDVSGRPAAPGGWRIVSVSDHQGCRCGPVCDCPATCRCVVTTLQDQEQLDAVLVALAACRVRP
jgi:hypothetical protein